MLLRIYRQPQMDKKLNFKESIQNTNITLKSWDENSLACSNVLSLITIHKSVRYLKVLLDACAVLYERLQ